MAETITLQGSYYRRRFLRTLEFQGDGYQITIENGRAIATLHQMSRLDEQLFARIHAEIASLFLGAQVESQTIELPRYTVVRLRPGVTREISVSSTISVSAS